MKTYEEWKKQYDSSVERYLDYEGEIKALTMGIASHNRYIRDNEFKFECINDIGDALKAMRDEYDFMIDTIENHVSNMSFADCATYKRKENTYHVQRI